MKKMPLRRARENRHFTLKGAAHLVGVSESWLSKVETNKATLHAGLLSRLRRAYNLTSDELVEVLDEAEASPAPDTAEVQP